MKARISVFVAVSIVAAALALPARSQTQASAQKSVYHHYKLIDLGTFGGPGSVENAEPTENFINQAGIIVGGADTPLLTPVPGCYNPVNNNDCYISHAFMWTNGHLTDLGTLPGGKFSYAEGINDSGQIVGVSENGKTDPFLGYPQFHAVLWQNGSIQDLGTLGGMSSFATTINDAGQIMGVSLNHIPDPYSIVGLGSMTTLTQTRGFLWQSGKMRDLGSLGGPDTFPIFMNQLGQIAGMSDTTETPHANTGLIPMDPFLWQNGEMKDLGNFKGTNPFGLFSGFVAGLNEVGQVTGTMTLPGDKVSHGFLWDGERLIDLNAGGGLGGRYSFTAGLNDEGTVVGAATLPRDTVQHAFIWKNGVMSDLGTPAGDLCSQAENINSLGQVVGASQSAQDCGGRFTHAFLWQNGAPIVDLNSLIPPGSPLELTVADYISDSGEIVGGGDPIGCANNDVCNHVYVLIPCDENHPGIEGCDYSPFDPVTESVHEAPSGQSSVQAPVRANVSQAEIGARLRSMIAGQHRWFASSPIR